MMKRRKPMSILHATPVRLFGALCAVALASCGDETKPEEENPNAEACEHMEMGPETGVPAAATASASAPKIDSNHRRYDVTTMAVSGGKGGYVTFAPTAAADYIFFTSEPVTLSVKSAAGADVAAKSTAASIPECTDVKGRSVYPLQVGTYIVGFTGRADKVSFVVEADE
jgi:hypothetical protein